MRKDRHICHRLIRFRSRDIASARSPYKVKILLSNSSYLHKILVSGTNFSIYDLKFWHVIWSVFAQAFKRAPFFSFFIFRLYFGQNIGWILIETALTPQQLFFFEGARLNSVVIRWSVPTPNFRSKFVKLSPESAFEWGVLVLAGPARMRQLWVRLVVDISKL